MGVKLQSSSGGSVEITAPVTASNYVLTAPAATGTLVYTDASGNLGVGTSSPTNKLHVYGGNGAAYIKVDASDTTLTGKFQARTGTSAMEFGSVSNSPLAFVTNDTERMRLDASGNLLVGTTSDPFGSYHKLVVSNKGLFQSTDANQCLTVQNTTGSGTRYYAEFRVGSGIGGATGSITTTGATTAYNTSSDYRLKENVAPLTNALDTIAALKPCTFTWKVDGSADRGFIAHELQEVIPQAVSGEKDAVNEDGSIKPQGVDYGKITPEIVAALQEAYAIINDLKAEIAEIKGRIA